MKDLKIELQRLYADSSKHSSYQNIPEFVSRALGYSESVDEGWRDDRPRLQYLIEQRRPAAGETWLDFGANTGFFTLSLANQFRQTHFIALEANGNHAQFVRRVAECFEMRNVEVIHRAAGLRDLARLPPSHFMLHLNVLHHAGHDFDKSLVPSRRHFEHYCQLYLVELRKVTASMLFQMGSNWGGVKSRPIVPPRDDGRKLGFIADLLDSSGWIVRSTCYPEKLDNSIVYTDVSLDDTRRIQTLDFLDLFPGEFYRRPMMLCDDFERLPRAPTP